MMVRLRHALVLLVLTGVSLEARQLPAPRSDNTAQGAVIHSEVFAADGVVRTSTWPYQMAKKFLIKTARVWMGLDSSALGDLFAMVTRTSDGSVLNFCSFDHYAPFTGPHWCDVNFPEGFALDPGESLRIQTSATLIQGGGSAHTIIVIWGSYPR